MNAQTHDNLVTALHGEAFAHARYRLFADAARASGDDDLAGLFEGIASVELSEHFAELAELARLAGSDTDNIRTVIEDERAEVDELYRSFEEQARNAGEDTVADRFAEIRGDERDHLDALEAALERLEVPA